MTQAIAGAATRGPRALEPTQQGYVERDGVRIFWEGFGEGERTILLLPPWAIVHSRVWKGQTPYLARHFRVLTFDPRGNGKSGRPQEPSAHDNEEHVADALAVMDAAGVERAALVGLSAGAQRALLLAANQPDRVEAVVFIAPAVPITPARSSGTPFDAKLEGYEGWDKFNENYWREDFQGFLEFFFGQVFCEPHSTKQLEDSIGWGLETTPETLGSGQGQPPDLGVPRRAATAGAEARSRRAKLPPESAVRVQSNRAGTRPA